MKGRIGLVVVFLLIIVHLHSAISRKIGVNCCSKTYDLSTNVTFAIRTANYYALNYSTCSNTFELGNSCPSMVVRCRKRIEEIGNPVDSTPDGLNFTYGETTARLLRNPKVKMQVCNSDMSSCTTTRRKIRTNETSMIVSFKTDSTDDGYGYTCTIKCDLARKIQDDLFAVQQCTDSNTRRFISCFDPVLNGITIEDDVDTSVTLSCCTVAENFFYPGSSDRIIISSGTFASCPADQFLVGLCADTRTPFNGCNSGPAISGEGALLDCSGGAAVDGIQVQIGATCRILKGDSNQRLNCEMNEVIKSVCFSETGRTDCMDSFVAIECCNVIRA